MAKRRELSRFLLNRTEMWPFIFAQGFMSASVLGGREGWLHPIGIQHRRSGPGPHCSFIENTCDKKASLRSDTRKTRRMNKGIWKSWCPGSEVKGFVGLDRTCLCTGSHAEPQLNSWICFFRRHSLGCCGFHGASFDLPEAEAARKD